MEKIKFLATDGIVLDGFIEKSQEETKNIILAVHGMASNAFKRRDDVIANQANQAGIDYFCFNNRGSELVKYIEKNIDGKKEKKLGGTCYEDVLEGYEDIVGAILKVKELGYQNIYLQGHSLGCTKIVYTYSELKDEDSKEILDSIKGVILLSLVDIPNSLKSYLGNKWEAYLKMAKEKEQEGRQLEFMPKEAFIHPISVKTFLCYARDYQDIDFAKFGEDNQLQKLNQIEVPLFMRWGNVKEMIANPANELVEMVTNSITNPYKDIDFIEGANHSYQDKEHILAEQIVSFIKKC